MSRTRFTRIYNARGTGFGELANGLGSPARRQHKRDIGAGGGKEEEANHEAEVVLR